MMFGDLLPLYSYAAPFLLVLFRVIGIFAFVPFFSNSAIPGNVKILLSLAIAFCVWNVVPGIAPGALPESLVGLVIAVAGELTVGLFIGLLVGAAFAGIQLGAHLVSQQMGLSMATLYDPSFEDQSTVIEQIAFWLGLVVFLTIGGHRQIVSAVVYSYQVVPLGGGGIRAEVMLPTLVQAMESSFLTATRIAMPALAAFFVATLTGGLMSRSLPQMNFMSLGVTINIMVGMFMITAGLAGWALVSQDTFRDLFWTIGKFFST